MDGLLGLFFLIFWTFQTLYYLLMWVSILRSINSIQFQTKFLTRLALFEPSFSWNFVFLNRDLFDRLSILIVYLCKFANFSERKILVRSALRACSLKWNLLRWKIVPNSVVKALCKWWIISCSQQWTLGQAGKYKTFSRRLTSQAWVCKGLDLSTKVDALD